MNTPLTKDIFLAIAFFVYPFLLLMVSKGLEASGARKDLSRKFVHAAMGLVILFVPFFDRLWVAIIPPIVFAAVNMLDYKFSLFPQIRGEDEANVGTILYPISYAILILIFFHKDFWGLAVLGILAMAFGDAGASVIGRAYGRTTYTVDGETRSVVGSTVMFVVTFVIAAIVFAAYGPRMGLTLEFMSVYAAAFIMAGVATAVEALSTRGSDNLTVPVLTALAGWALVAVLHGNVLGSQAIVNQPLF
jgi:phytol kinase